MTDKIIFLDIDGPMIPGRSYKMAGQTKPIVMKFDPVAVSIINDACEHHDRKIVIHSSWLRVFGLQETYVHCLKEGLLDAHFHNEALCNGHDHYRYDRVLDWLSRHPEVDDFVIVDDDLPDFMTMEFGPDHEDDYSKKLRGHILPVDFDDGLLMSHWRKLRDGNWSSTERDKPSERLLEAAKKAQENTEFDRAAETEKRLFPNA